MERYSSFSYIIRLVRGKKQEETRNWILKATSKGGKKKYRAYSLPDSLKLDPQLS
jgi:hypothetical protein